MDKQIETPVKELIGSDVKFLLLANLVAHELADKVLNDGRKPMFISAGQDSQQKNEAGDDRKTISTHLRYNELVSMLIY